MIVNGFYQRLIQEQTGALVEALAKTIVAHQPDLNVIEIQGDFYQVLAECCKGRMELTRELQEGMKAATLEKTEAEKPSRVVKNVDDFIRPDPDND